MADAEAWASGGMTRAASGAHPRPTWGLPRPGSLFKLQMRAPLELKRVGGGPRTAPTRRPNPSFHHIRRGRERPISPVRGPGGSVRVGSIGAGRGLLRLASFFSPAPHLFASLCSFSRPILSLSSLTCKSTSRRAPRGGTPPGTPSSAATRAAYSPWPPSESKNAAKSRLRVRRASTLSSIAFNEGEESRAGGSLLAGGRSAQV